MCICIYSPMHVEVICLCIGKSYDYLCPQTSLKAQDGMLWNQCKSVFEQRIYYTYYSTN
jgi:hypothetical protein